MNTEIVKFRVSKLDKKVIQHKAAKCGLSVSEFLRRAAFDKEIKTRLTEEEIRCYQTLSNYADNFRRISNLFKAGDVTVMKK